MEFYDSEHIREPLEEGTCFLLIRIPYFGVGALFTHEDKQNSVLRRDEREAFQA